MTELDEARKELAKIRRDSRIGMILAVIGIAFGILSLILRWLS